MDITSFTEDVKVIQALSDTPAIPAGDLKKKFDTGSMLIKDYINQTLIPDVKKAVSAMQDRIPGVVNNLAEDSTDKALSAAMGKRLNDEKQKKITFGTDAPSGGEDGDIYIRY